MKHPRTGQLAKLIREAATVQTVSAVEVRWETVDGRDVPVWRIEFGEKPRVSSAPIDWSDG